MNITIAGGTGFIGKALVKHFIEQGHTITLLSRNHHKIENTFGNTVQGFIWDEFEMFQKDFMGDSDLIINLTGANISEKRWSRKRKQEILSSRIHPTQLLAQSCAALGKSSPPLFNASAVGIYGLQKPITPDLPKPYTEEHSINFEEAPDFSAKIVRAWERATHLPKSKGVRVVNMRFAVVLAANGGALARLKHLYSVGLGGPIGRGLQPFPWITLIDLIAAIDFLITHSDIVGPVNFVSPQCISQKEFATALGSALHRPSFMKTPAFILRIIFGKMADELLLNGQCAYPEVLLKNGFEFQYPEITKALASIYSNPD